ncbi:MAG: response regulator [Magnetococcales bacterium]|nr:response regulator [Magnetococcales bacterium]
MNITGQNVNPIEILLIEDNPGDARLAEESFKESKLLLRINHVEDGEQAMSYLLRHPPFEQATRPNLILLDLNLPKKDGRDVLSEIKSNETLKRIPVVVLTTSNANEDIDMAYDLHANCYIKKPLDFNQFMKVITNIEAFWFTVVQLPEDKCCE